MNIDTLVTHREPIGGVQGD